MSILEQALLAVLPIYKKRIFVDGLDSNDKLIGTYNPVYKEYREQKGLQVQKVNLTVTGGLKKSIVVENNKLGFKDKEHALIAQKLEKKYSVPIFKFTKKEVAFIYKFIADNYGQAKQRNR